MRSIEAAAVAGLAFALLFFVAKGIFEAAPEPGSDDAAVQSWYADAGNQRSMIAGLNLLIVGSIAFIWFVAVIRRRVGERENRFFGSVFFGSALVLVASWLVAGVLITTPAVSAHLYGVVMEASDVAAFQSAGVTMASVVAARLEAVFIVSSTTVARLSGALPRLLIVLGYAAGLTLLLIPVPNQYVSWVFPSWVAVVSSAMLIGRTRLEDLSGDEEIQTLAEH